MATSDVRSSKSLLTAYDKLGNTESISDFLESVDNLMLEAKRLIVDQAIVIIDQLYAHLPLKRAMHAVNPVQRLRLLRHRLKDLEDPSFHTEMISIFKGLRDAHTNYGLPSPYKGKIAFLPFLMEDFFENGERRFLVTRVLFGFNHRSFKPGVKVTHWNGTPVERAVRLNADREEGSNMAARFAFGLSAMTVRYLDSSLPPDEEWVIVGYETNGESHEIIFPWRIWDINNDPRPDLSGEHGEKKESINAEALSMSICTRVNETHRARKMLFAPKATEVEERIAGICEAVRAASKKLGDRDLSDIDLSAIDPETESVLPNVFQFQKIENLSKEFGYIRIRTFNHSPVAQFFNEFLRILELMPGDGLILDVRGNGGGIIMNGELLLQLLTPKTITPEPFHFINTSLTQELCSVPKTALSTEIAEWRADLANTWGTSIAQSIETGAVFSKGVPLTSPELCNAFGQFYHGPVVLITDAQCYSTTDIFAAGFQDHGIGAILGVDPNTGAGGANVWTHNKHLVALLPGTDSEIQPLPVDTTMRVSIRRSTRVGPNAGQPLEDLGVKPDERHDMTKDDLLNSNIDLITKATEMLAAKPSYQLNVEVTNIVEGTLSIKATTKNIERLDCYTNGRPTLTTDVNDGVNALDIPVRGGAVSELELKGYTNGDLVAKRKLGL